MVRVLMQTRWISFGLCTMALAGACEQHKQPTPNVAQAGIANADALAAQAALTHAWSMPEGASRIQSGKLGTEPAVLADKLMASGVLPTWTHQLASNCAPTVEGPWMLRFSIDQAGTFSPLQSEPALPCAATYLEQHPPALAGLGEGRITLALTLSSAPQPAQP